MELSELLEMSYLDLTADKESREVEITFNKLITDEWISGDRFRMSIKLQKRINLLKSIIIKLYP